jgi:hypothetical protein
VEVSDSRDARAISFLTDQSSILFAVQIDSLATMLASTAALRVTSRRLVNSGVAKRTFLSAATRTTSKEAPKNVAPLLAATGLTVAAVAAVRYQEVGHEPHLEQ